MKRWAPVTSLRIGPPDSNWLEASSPFSNSRALVERDSIVEMLLGSKSSSEADLIELGLLSDANDAGELSAALFDRIERWRDRGWSAALDWYLWSRSPNYVDDGPEAGAARLRAVGEYLANSPCPDSRRAGSESVALALEGRSAESLGWALQHRQSRGSFSGAQITKEALVETLVVGLERLRSQRSGPDEAIDPASLLRSHGCALDVYVVAYDVGGVDAGLYFFEPERQLLDPLSPGDLRPVVSAAFGGQPDQRSAAALIALVADFDSYGWRYRHERALRNLYIDAGRVMGRLVMAASSLRLQTGITPLLRDSEMRSLLGLSSDRFAVVHTLTLAGEVGS